MRTLFAAAFLCCCISIHASELKPVATVHLSCDSRAQVVSPSGDQIAVRCKDQSLLLIDIATGREQHAFAADENIASYNYSRDGRWFAVGRKDGSVEIVPKSGPGAPKRWKAGTRRIDTVQFLVDSDSILIAGADQPGQVWDISGTPKVRASLRSDFAGLVACAVSPDGKLLATADGDTALRVYDTSTWKMTHEYRGFKLETFAVPFTSDGKYLLLGGADDHISVLDLSSGKEVHRLGGEPGVVADILPLGDTHRAAVVYADGDGIKPPHLVVWNLDTFTSEPLTAGQPLSGGGLVQGELWLVSATGRSLQVWKYE